MDDVKDENEGVIDRFEEATILDNDSDIIIGIYIQYVQCNRSKVYQSICLQQYNTSQYNVIQYSSIQYLSPSCHCNSIPPLIYIIQLG